MHIAVCGPATLSSLQHLVDQPISSEGYPFPGTSELILKYIEKGHRVSLVTTASDIRESLVYHSPQLDVHVVPSRSRARERALDFFAAERRGVLRALKEIEPDVVHAHWTYEFGLAARACGVPALVTVHDWAPAIARHNRHLYWYFRAAMQFRCLARRGLTTAPSAYVADKVTKYYRRRCLVVGNGFDLMRYIGQRRQDTDRVAVGMLNVGYSSLKNVSTAITAWPAVRKVWPDAILHLAGPDYQVGGPAWKYANDNGVADGILFEGPISATAVPDWFHTKNIFLHTSLEESFGMVVGEAMASGTPVVAGLDSGAVAETTQGAALLIDIRSPNAVSDAVIRALRDPALLQSLSERGIRAAESFSLSNVADKYLDILSDCKRQSGKLVQ